MKLFEIDYYIDYLSIKFTSLCLIWYNIENKNFIIDQYKKFIICNLIHEYVYFIYKSLNYVNSPNLHVSYIIRIHKMFEIITSSLIYILLYNSCCNKMNKSFILTLFLVIIVTYYEYMLKKVKENVGMYHYLTRILQI